MFTLYSQALGFEAALDKTFQGELCSLCEVVDQGRQRTSDQALLSTSQERPQLLIPQSARGYLRPLTPDPLLWRFADHRKPCARKQEPPTPPPRRLA
jgi:hypothetical protein